jgi:ribosomal protein S18 acetylase RimI-like enzyme
MTMVRLATDSDIRSISLTYARAFADDPVWQWFCPFDDLIDRIAILYEGALRYHDIPNGRVYITEDAVSAAVWMPPNRQEPSKAQAEALASTCESCFGPYLERFQQSISFLVSRRPVEAYWYLSTLATHPDWQGQGLASKVMQPVLEQCDADHVIAYLESTKKTNVPFYHRHGFEVTDTVDLPGGGPEVYLMLRKPQ